MDQRELDRRKLHQAFGDQYGEGGWQLSLREIRSFPELLGSWMELDGCKGDIPLFLQKTGLSGMITPAMIDAVLYSKAAPGPHLVSILFAALPGEALRPAGPILPHFSYRTFTRSAARFRTENMSLPLAEMEEPAFEQARLQVLKHIAATSPASTPSGETESGEPVPEDPLYIALTALAAEAAIPTDELIETLQEHYEESPLTTLQTTTSLLAKHLPGISDALLEQFFSTHKKGAPASARALRFLRQSGGLEQQDIGHDVGVHASHTGQWERGLAIPLIHLGALTRSLNLSPALAEAFILLVHPALIEKTGIGWLQQKLAKKDFSSLSFPALDPQWLAKQDRQKQPGLLLHSFRIRRGLWLQDIAEAVGLAPNTLVYWESGEKAMDPAKLGPLIACLQLTRKEAMRFALLIRPELTEHIGARWLARTIDAQQWDFLSFPALDPDWLDAQPEDKQTGLLLRDLRRSRHLSKRALGPLIGVEASTLVGWESGRVLLDETKLGSIIAALSLDEPTALRFAVRVRPELATPPGWLQARIHARKWEALNFPAFDPPWLAAQPAARQAGLLLYDLRKSKGLFQGQVADAIGIKNNTLTAWESGASPIDATRLGPLLQYLEPTVKQATRLSLLVRPEFTEHIGIRWLVHTVREKRWENLSFPALDPHWLNAQPAPVRASHMVRTFRDRKGVTADEVAIALDVPKDTAKGWEYDHRVSPSKVSGIITYYALPPKEIARFVLAVDPTITEKAGTRWLLTVIREQNWQYLAFPALDPRWLEVQPAEKQAGLLLRAFRDRCEYKRPEAAKILGLGKKVLESWERGEALIVPSVIASKQEALHISDEELAWFQRVVAISDPAVREQNRVKRATRVQAGAALPVKDAPELLPPDPKQQEPGR